MLDIILSFFGLRASGFKRNNLFFNFLGKISQSRFNKKSINYLIASLFSAFILINDSYYPSNTYIFKKIVTPYFIRVKCFINELTEFPKVISGYVNLKSENKNLRREIDDLKIKITTSKSAENELMELKKAVNLKYSFSKYKTIEKILGFDKSSYESFLIISATNEVSKKGSVVISSDGLVGIIFDSNSNFARVMTISDQKICIPVKSLTGEHLIISGNGKNSMISIEIKESDFGLKTKISPGDILYTSGEGGVFQSDIPVAKVTNVGKNGVILAEPFVNIDKESFVWIIKPFLS